MRSSGRHDEATGASAGGRHGEAGGSSGRGRRCTRNGCREPAIATLTYVYAASTAVVGPLAAYPEPHTYDLCEWHARSLTAPRGWELVRHAGELPPPPPDDLLALAEAVREVGPPLPDGDQGPAPARPRLRLIPPA